MADQKAPWGDINMSTNRKPRSERAKDAASDDGASRKASAGGRRDGKGEASEFRLLPETATPEQHVASINEHTGAVTRCRRLERGHCYCVGCDVIALQAKLDLHGKEWDAYCARELPFSSRQARDYTVLVRAFESIEEMLKVVPEGASLANAVLIARARVNPEEVVPTDDVPPDDEPKTHEPGNGGDGPPTPVPPEPRAPEPGPSRETAALMDGIMRIVLSLGDSDLALLKQVHALLTKRHGKGDAAAGDGQGNSGSEAKPRKAARKA